MTALWQVVLDGGHQLARGPADTGPEDLLPPTLSLDGLLADGAEALAAAVAGPSAGPVPPHAVVAAPIGSQEVWASGVTYLRSREARMRESESPDFYDHVYDADRPELFFKATAERVRGPGQPIGIRADSTWDVPEPELGVVADAGGTIAAWTIGNDVSSRSIEGENPLYLPQAKTYTGSCALGPCWLPAAALGPLDEVRIAVRITGGNEVRYADSVEVAQMKRRPDELVEWLFRALDFPRGVILLTGTALVPDDNTTLQPGDEVTIAISGLGELSNRVERTGGNPA